MSGDAHARKAQIHFLDSREDRGVLPDEEPIGTVLDRTCIGCGSDYHWISREGFQWPTSYCTRACKRKSAYPRRTKLDSPEQIAADGSDGMVLLMLPAGRCLSCGKVASPTKADAKRMKREIEAKAGRTNEVRYYQCDDGWWHWTRMTASLEGWRAEREMTTSPASLRHQGRGAWRHLGDAR